MSSPIWCHRGELVKKWNKKFDTKSNNSTKAVKNVKILHDKGGVALDGEAESHRVVC